MCAAKDRSWGMATLTAEEESPAVGKKKWEAVSCTPKEKRILGMSVVQQLRLVSPARLFGLNL